MPDFINTEHCVEKLFPVGTTFSFEGKKYQVALCGKPRPARGECKTDVYIKGIASDGEAREIKISVKQKNADFLENKMSFDRACEIFGKDASGIIKQCLLSIQDSFVADNLVYFEKKGKTGAHTMKLGWKFELLNKLSGEKSGALKLTEMGINCIGIPGTIDNDIPNTDCTVGFDTALNTIVDALDRLRDTSSSHQRCTILEVMGRRCGDLAINAGIAAGAEMIITSEIGFDEKQVIERLKAAKKSDKKHAIVVITEHITDVNELAKKIEAETGFETRANVLGHMQRGGRPSARDRVLASRMGVYAVELLEAGKGGLCVSVVNGEIKGLDIIETLSQKRKTDFGIYEDAMKLR